MGLPSREGAAVEPLSASARSKSFILASSPYEAKRYDGGRSFSGFVPRAPLTLILYNELTLYMMGRNDMSSFFNSF